MNDTPNYLNYLARVVQWELRTINEGNIKQLIFPSTSHREAVQIANYLRRVGKYDVKVKKHSQHFQEIIITKPV